MDMIRKSSFIKYVKWYLQREKSKGKYERIPILPGRQQKLMQLDHCGKLWDWCERAIWNIACITQDEFERLMVLEGDWTEDVGLVCRDSSEPDYRLLRNTAKRAMEMNFLELSTDKKMKEYYDQLKRGHIRLEGKDRIVLRSLESNEKTPRNPHAFLYLQDGFGRSLPYQILIMEECLSYEPVEAFAACCP